MLCSVLRDQTFQRNRPPPSTAAYRRTKCRYCCNVIATNATANVVFLVIFLTNMSKIGSSTAAETDEPALMPTMESPSSSSSSDITSNHTQTALTESELIDDVILIVKASIMIMIIVAAIFGNLLVIVSVMRVRKLR